MKKPRMVFLDGGTVNYGDLSFKPLAKIGKLKTYSATKPAQMKLRLRGADIAITNKCRFSRELLENLPDLKGIFVTATGTNNIDHEAARELKIALANVPGYSTESVTQFTISFILALAGNLISYNRVSHDGTWSRSQFFTYGAFPVREVHGKKLGIVGYGAIGKRVAQVARALGMQVLIGKIPGRTYSYKENRGRVSFDTLIKQSDFVTVHAPLTPLTQDLINDRIIRKMKRSACLLNMARGGIVNEKALRRALESGRLAGAAVDVLTQEPPPKNHVLLGAPNLLMTPHIAWASLEARLRLMDEVVLNLRAFLQGKKRNRIV